MGEIKSAWEKAMEKVEKLGKPSEEELKSLEYIPLGNTLAARYFKEEKYDLDAELTKYKGSGVRKYVIQGVQEILIRNINLPRDNRAKEIAKRAMSGLRLIKQNKNQVDTIFGLINNLFSYYEQARQQTYMQLRQNFEAKLQEATRAVQQQLGNRVTIQPELQPQFQEEWRKANIQLDAQYEKVLEEHKEQILKIA